jgi:hypothetical protein
MPGADVAYKPRFSFEIDQGISYEYKDAEGQRKAVHIYPSIIKTREQCFWCVNQFSIVGKQTPSGYYHLHQRNTFGAFELKKLV